MSHKKMHYAWWIVVCCSALTLGSTGIIYNSLGIFLSPVSIGLAVSVSGFVSSKMREMMFASIK